MLFGFSIPNNLKKELNVLELRDIQKVYVLYKWRDVNNYLDVGWELLHIGQYCSCDDGEYDACTCFTVGWPYKNGEPKEP